MKLLAKGIVTVDPKAKTVNIPMPPGTDILKVVPGGAMTGRTILKLIAALALICLLLALRLGF